MCQICVSMMFYIITTQFPGACLATFTGELPIDVAVELERARRRVLPGRFVVESTNNLPSINYGETVPLITIPRGSMYGIFTYIHHKNQPNVGKYTIHGWYGIDFP